MGGTGNCYCLFAFSKSIILCKSLVFLGICYGGVCLLICGVCIKFEKFSSVCRKFCELFGLSSRRGKLLRHSG
jgi:hypothetical protein